MGTLRLQLVDAETGEVFWEEDEPEAILDAHCPSQVTEWFGAIRGAVWHAQRQLALEVDS